MLMKRLPCIQQPFRWSSHASFAPSFCICRFRTSSIKEWARWSLQSTTATNLNLVAALSLLLRLASCKRPWWCSLRLSTSSLFYRMEILWTLSFASLLWLSSHSLITSSMKRLATTKTKTWSPETTLINCYSLSGEPPQRLPSPTSRPTNSKTQLSNTSEIPSSKSRSGSSTEWWMATITSACASESVLWSTSCSQLCTGFSDVFMCRSGSTSSHSRVCLGPSTFLISWTSTLLKARSGSTLNSHSFDQAEQC